jgi:membrane fusion protein (multidrug efflux system)
MRRRSFIALLILAAIAAAAWFWSDRIDMAALQELIGRQSGATTQPANAVREMRDPVAVEVATVTVGPISTRVSALGTLQANQSVTIQPEIAGKVVKVGFREGDRVKSGSVLIELDRSILSAEAEQAKTSLDLAEVNYRRADVLAKQGIGTARSRDEATATYHNAQTSLELARARLQKTTIVAPFDGVVGLSDVTIGRYLAIGDRIVNLESIDPLKVDFRVPELFLSALRVGQPVAIAVDAFPDRDFRGEVYAIDPLVDVGGRAVRLRARVPNADGTLRPGLFARVRLTIDQRPSAMLIPESALVPQERDRFVYRVVENHVSFVKVKIGERRIGEVEILSGLKPGDMVVTAGQLKLYDGAAVDIRPSANRTALE